ncbi:MAG: MopE-related protein [Bacteroidia bacterium]
MKNKFYTKTSLERAMSICWKGVLSLLVFVSLGTSINAQTATIGTGVLTAAGTNGVPIYRSSTGSSFHHSKSIQLITAAQLSTAGVTSGASITGWGYNKTNNGIPSATTSWTLNVYLKNTSNTVLTSGTAWNTMISGATLAYTATITNLNMPAATGYWVWPTTGFNYSGGAIEAYIEWFPAVLGANPFTTNTFSWQYTASGNQAMGTSNSVTLPGTTSVFTTQARFYNTRINYSTTPCAGQPNPGNTIASAASVCSGSNVNLSLQNPSTGSGISYAWEHSDDDVNWTPFGGNAPSASFTMGAIPKYFHCIVSCINNPNPGTSNSVLVNLNTTAFPEDFTSAIFPPNCFSETDASSFLDRQAPNGFGLAGTGSARWNFFNASNGTVMTLTSPTLSAPAGANTTLKFDVAGSTYTGGEIDHIFVEESVNGGTNWTLLADLTNNPAGGALYTKIGAPTTATFIPTAAEWATLSFPVNASANRFRLRGVSNFGNMVYADNLILETLPPCIDPPTAGTAQSNILQFCNNSTVNLNLSLTGNSTGVGQTYQWQYSTDGVDYYDIIGATTAAWTENGVSISYYYQCNVTCGASTVPSASVFVQAVPPPVAGLISGPGSGLTNTAISYSSTGEVGSLQWQGRLLPSGTFANVVGGTNNPQNIFFSTPGTYEIRLVTSVSGCTNEISNVVTTVISVAGDNVCNAVPVNIGVNGPFSNVGATIQPGEAQAPNTTCSTNNTWCPGTSGLISNSVWFSFTVPSGGSGRYGVAIPGFDSQVAVWSANSCGDLLSGLGTLIAANDDSVGGGLNAYARAHCLVPGQTYYIQMDGYGTTTNAAFAVRIDDFGPANPSFSGIGATVCENAGLVTLTPAVAGGVFSGTGVSGNSFNPALAAAGFHTITYTLGGLDICYSSSQTVEVVTPTFTYYADVDGDTYGNAGVSILSCAISAPVGYSADATDCNDANPSINPGATELCNGIDDDCNGIIDNGFDVDNDGFTSCGGDCNDNDNTVYPGATEVCNGVDDDCNLLVDDGLTFITYYADVDGDTYGDASSTVSTCNGAPMGYVSNSSDCNDNNAAVNPAATEICNLIDDDCDGLIDENLLVAGPISGPSVQCMAVVTGSATFSISPVFDATGYSWTVPNGMIIVSGQGTTSIFVSWAPQAVHDGIIGNIVVTPSNACGNGTPSSLGADIGAIIPVKPGSISGPTKLCPGDNGVYSVAPVARASNYIWTLPTGMSILSGAGTNVITVDVNGAYLGGTVSCRAANACGMGPNRDRTVNVNVPAASASISGQASGVCSSNGVVYTATAVPAATSYNWSVPVGATIMSGQGSSSITVDFDGTYAGGNVSVNASNACGTGAARNLSVTGAPGLPGVITGDITICPGQSGVAYGVSTVTGASSYLWSLPGGTTITSGQGTKDILATWGTNPASGLNLSVNASNSCGTSANRVLNGISISVAHCGPRFGDQGEITGLNVYPNPAADRATVVFTSTEGADFNIKMVDVSGRTIMTERGTATNGLNQREVNVSEMSAGIYFVVIETNNVVEQIKMIVE